MNEKNYFDKVLNLSFEKFKKERIKHGNSWLICNINLLEKYLKLHFEKYQYNKDFNQNKKISDLIDLINYSIMIIIREKYYKS